MHICQKIYQADNGLDKIKDSSNIVFNKLVKAMQGKTIDSILIRPCMIGMAIYSYMDNRNGPGRFSPTGTKKNGE